MNKNDLIPGQKYLHREAHIINSRTIKAQRWLKCEEITEDGAVFSRYFEDKIPLNNQEIEEELIEEWK